jgi:hypothetical protein
VSFSFLLVICYPPPPSISNGDLPVALKTLDGAVDGGLIVVKLPGAFDTDGGTDFSICGGGEVA